MLFYRLNRMCNDVRVWLRICFVFVMFCSCSFRVLLPVFTADLDGGLLNWLIDGFVSLYRRSINECRFLSAMVHSRWSWCCKQIGPLCYAFQQVLLLSYFSFRFGAGTARARLHYLCIFVGSSAEGISGSLSSRCHVGGLVPRHPFLLPVEYD